MKSTNKLNNPGSEEKIKIEFFLTGEDAERFSLYQSNEKFKKRTPAAYKLIMEGLDRYDSDRGSEK